MPTCEDGACTTREVDCSDGDACTEDRCDPVVGCVHRSLTVDGDGDGHPGARPGFAPGSLEACGDDCDDRNASVFPGAVELCDGVDNDCDGVIDNGSSYTPSGAAPVRIGPPGSVGRETLGGLAATDREFVVSYAARRGSASQSFLASLDPSGARLAEAPLTNVNANTYGGTVISAAGIIAVVASDARQSGNYEIYFSRFRSPTEKLGPDVRLTNAPEASLHPELVWTGSEFVVVWDDHRGERSGASELTRIYGQRVSAAGELVGGNVLLTPDESLAEEPDVALGPGRIGLAFVSGREARLAFRVLTPELEVVGTAAAPIGEDVQSPGVYWVRDRFVVVFSTAGVLPGDAIWAATYAADGRMLDAPRRVTTGARFARWNDAVSLGDRLLLVWSDDAAGNYDVYYQTLSPELTPLLARRRLTSGANDSIGPVVTMGPRGTIGVAFEDAGTFQSYLLTLRCE